MRRVNSTPTAVLGFLEKPSVQIMPHELALVMPVCNEQACIVAVVQSWLDVLSRLNIDFRFIILNDGSTDGTEEALAVFEHDRRLHVINKQNTGHGPTILLGYRQAVELGEWVFQCDSDDEMKADYFPCLWEKRKEYHALLGKRAEYKQTRSRKFVSICSRIAIRLLYGSGVADVNTPFRLIRSNVLKQFVNQIPDDTFAPNILISGMLARTGARIYEHPVPHEGRRTGKTSLVRLKLWRCALKAFWQTLTWRRVVVFIDDKAAGTPETVRENGSRGGR